MHACVPLGILGHELDLASQTQNQKIISQVIVSAKFEATADLASPFVRATEGVATASSQIFGDTVFLSFSLSPKTTEDLPQELGRLVSEEAAKYGLKSAMVVNTHNSITDVIDVEHYVGALQTAASKCLQKAVALQTATVHGWRRICFSKRIHFKGRHGHRRNHCYCCSS